MGLVDIQEYIGPHQCAPHPMTRPDEKHNPLWGKCIICGMSRQEKEIYNKLPDPWPPLNISIPDAGRYP